MKEKDSIGTRMKSFYEERFKYHLMRRTPVIVRCDGKSFHNFCRRFKKPYDELLNHTLNNVLLYLCKNVQGAKFGSRHSDEMSILLTDYDTINTDAYFDYEVQKICSITAAMASVEFCKQLEMNTPFIEDVGLQEIITRKEDWPVFDSRCFNVPESEIANYFYWRLLDCKRCSIAMLAQSKFSHKELHGVSSNRQQEMLFQKCGINWNDIPQGQKSGFVCVREMKEKPAGEGCKPVMRHVWSIYEGPKTKEELDNVIANSCSCWFDESF